MVSDGGSDVFLLASSKRSALNHETGALGSTRSTLCPPVLGMCRNVKLACHMKSQRSAASGHCNGDSARGGGCAATGRALGMGSREGTLLINEWLLKLQSRPRIRRLKLSGTVQGLVEEPAAFDGRTIRARLSVGARRAALARVAQVWGAALNVNLRAMWTTQERRHAKRSIS